MSEERMNPAFQRILQYFQCDHLPSQLSAISSACAVLAHDMVVMTEGTDNPAEVTVGLRKLLEAKDCFVRSMIK